MSNTRTSPSKRMEDSLKLSPGHKSLDAELYGLGHTLRHLEPPGGKGSGVFNALRTEQEPLTPRKKVKDYLKSHIFDDGIPLPPRPATPQTEKTHDHLFAVDTSPNTEKRHNRMKSTVFDPDLPQNTPETFRERNPITGESWKDTDDGGEKKERLVRNPITFEGIKERHVTSRCTQPPGGKCSFVLEYIE